MLADIVNLAMHIRSRSKQQTNTSLAYAAGLNGILNHIESLRPTLESAADGLKTFTRVDSAGK